MKILLTADLHMNIPARSPRTGFTNFEAFSRSVASESPDAVVVAGDIATARGGRFARKVRRTPRTPDIASTNPEAIAIPG